MSLDSPEATEVLQRIPRAASMLREADDAASTSAGLMIASKIPPAGTETDTMVAVPKLEPPILPPDWQDPATVERIRDALRSERFPWGASGPIEFVQTHISSVFLTPRFAVKFKRPANVGFADFRSLEARLHFCREEVRLNRRLAPDVYLDVIPLRRNNGRFTFGVLGEVADYAVVMNRLPAKGMLDARLAAGVIRPQEIEALARKLAEFHANLPPSPEGARFGGIATWMQNWDENFEQTLPEAGTTIPTDLYRAIGKRIYGFLARNEPLLQARISGGFIRDGHGDLRCEHICLSDPIRIIDCIEFNERFRIGDVANDIAFLLMDLCALGRPELASGMLDRYVGMSGDATALPLIAFYCCYRAFVRGKVLGMRLRDRNLTPEQRQRTIDRARAFFSLAGSFSRQMGPPALIVMCGLMGSGKSTVAGEIAARTGAAVISSDRVRKELAAGGQAADQTRGGFGQGLYAAEWTQRTYDELLARGKEFLRAGRSVILDATFSRRPQRESAFALAQRAGVEAYLVECVAPDEVTLNRLAARNRLGTSMSDGRPELYESQKTAFDPVSEVHPSRHRVVLTERPAEEAVSTLLTDPNLHIPDPLFGDPKAKAFG